MRILQLTKKFPFPLRDGEAWAVLTLAKSLKKRNLLIDLFSLNTVKHYADDENIASLKAHQLYGRIFTKNASVKPSIPGAIVNILGDRSYHAERFDLPKVRSYLHSILGGNKYDVVIVESIFMMSYIATIRALLPDVKIVLRSHNVEHLIWERYAQSRSGLIKKYLHNQSVRLQAYERDMINRADGVMAMSSVDLSLLINRCGLTSSSLICPIGMELLDNPEREEEDRPFIVGYIGSMDWRPNLEGLEWFLKMVWDKIQESETESILMIAGRNSDSEKVWQNHRSVTFMGEVEDSDLFLKNIDMLIVPLWSGSGIRVKILQAFRNHTPVLTTSIGIEGLAVTNELEVLISDDANAWLSLLEEMADNLPARIKLAEKASNYLAKKHNPDLIANEVVSFFDSL